MKISAWSWRTPVPCAVAWLPAPSPDRRAPSFAGHRRLAITATAWVTRSWMMPISWCSRAISSPSPIAAASALAASSGSVSGVSRRNSHSGAKPRWGPVTPALLQVSTSPDASKLTSCGSPETLISRVSLLEMVGKPHLLARAFDRQRPRPDRLRGAADGHQPQPLQRVVHRLVVAVFGAVGDLEAHLSRTCSPRRPGRRAGCCRR